METMKTAQAPSSIFLPDPLKFTVSKITVHDATSAATNKANTTAPAVLTMSVDRISSGVSIQYSAHDTMEYIQDPEDCHHNYNHAGQRQRHSASPAPGTPQTESLSKELPPLLLKVQAREGLSLSFELTGNLLDSTQQRPIAEEHTHARTVTQTGSNLIPDKRPGNDYMYHPEQSDTKGGAASVTHNHTTDRNSLAAALQDGMVTSSSVDGQHATKTTLITAPEQASTTGLYAPTIYFAETRTEQSMHDLCSEAAFQQQLLENPGSISTVQPMPSSEGIYSWEWSYQTEERTERGPQSHKAVFSFMTRSRATGALELLFIFSLWIEHRAASTTSNGVRFPSSIPHQSSAWNARHWRRSSTPEKTSNISRLPSFWNKLPAFPPSHNSLPSLQDAPSRIDGDRGVAERMGTPSPSLANDTEDGPLFRATVVECEQHIRNMKTASKRILKAAQTVLETRKAWVAAEDAFVKELDLIKPAEALVEQYWRPLSEHLIEQSEMISQHMRDLLIEPFSRFYGIDIKAAELHRKSFEDESKDYYSFLSRYMGMKQDNTQKKLEADAKHEKKRRHFEQKRLEYWKFLIEMRAGGSKNDELFFHLSNYTEKHCQHVVEIGVIAEELQPAVITIATASKQRQEQNRRRPSVDEASALLRPPSRQYTRTGPTSILTQSMVTATSSNISLESPRTPYFERDSFDLTREPVLVAPSPVYGVPPRSDTSSPGISGIRDLEHQDIDAGLALGRRKEGFLFATSRPSPHNVAVLEKPNNNWHKYWCVLSEGQLHEYSHWKKGVTQPHNEPINLRIATVRSCRNQDRRFCFEVITPKFRRVYQATSAEDMNSWISVISNAIQGLLNGTSSCRNLNLEYTSGGYRAGGQSDGKGLMAGLGGMARASMEQVLNATSLPSSLKDRVQPGQAVGRKRGGSAADGLNELGHIMHPITTQANSPNGALKDSEQLGAQLLRIMRELHPNNSVCADCGAKNPDWCVINLGILVCIECSGIHRSLGTHISKVRSFNLDTTSYTKDLFEFIRSVGNNVSNGIWEANMESVKDEPQLSQTSQGAEFRKPVVNDAREYKVAFIRKKYVEKAFVRRASLFNSTESATDALFRAVSANDIPGVIGAFAAGANLNTVQRAHDESDSGPFIEQQEALSQPPPLPPRQNEDTFNLGDIPNTTHSPILDDSLLQPLDDSIATSETSSQFSRSTKESYPISITEPSEEGGVGAQYQVQEQPQGQQHQVGSLEIRPRPAGMGRPISSVMVLQTSPLLIALRHGVPFMLDDRFEVYPLAEFLMQNGAASNMRMEVKLMVNNGDLPASVPKVMAPPTGTNEPRLSAALSGLRKGARIRSEENATEGVIERDAPLQPSVSIGSRLSGGAILTSVTPSASSSLASLRSSEAVEVDIVDKNANRRSVGQIVELRGEDGARAMEYLRAKSVARGETLTTPPPNASISALPAVLPTLSSSGSAMMTGTTRGTQSWQGGSKLRPSSLKDMSVASISAPSMSSVLINKLTLSPRLRPSGSMTSASGPAFGSTSIPTPLSLSGNHYDSRTVPANPTPSYPPPVWTNNLHHNTHHNHQDISALFQKRRDSDGGGGGIGSAIFSTIRPSSARDKDRAAVKAQARRSGDFSLFRPVSIISSFSQHSDASSSNGGAYYNSAYSPTMSEHDVVSLSFPEGNPVSNEEQASRPNSGASSSTKLETGASGISNSRNGANVAITPSRTQKVKATLTRSIRMSAKYFRTSVIKDEREKEKATAAALKNGTQSGASMSATLLGDDDLENEPEDEDEEDGVEELSMAELLAQQDQQEQQQQQQQQHQQPQTPHLQWSDIQLTTSSPSPSTNRASSLSFFSGMSFSSTPNLSQKDKEQEQRLDTSIAGS